LLSRCNAHIDREKAYLFESRKEILILLRLKCLKQDSKKYIGRKLAARVLNTWHEDFVDEDTGEVVSIERNEIILDRDTIIDKDNVEEIIDSNVKSILLHKERS
jgi:DNA-directed RNA polymerase subunit beta